MVKKKDEYEFSLKESLERLRAETEARPLVATRWYVTETTPAHRDWGYDGQYHSARVVQVSSYFDSRDYNDDDSLTKAAAQQWLDEHEPDEGKTLGLMKQCLRVHTEEKWGWG